MAARATTGAPTTGLITAAETTVEVDTAVAMGTVEGVLAVATAKAAAEVGAATIAEGADMVASTAS
jgi:hypothetical protein